MLIDFERRCWAEINLSHLLHNVSLIQHAAGAATVMAVVKANAYGHGDLITARTLADAGVRCFAVSGLSEAVRLRRAGLTQPILILGYTSPEHVEQLNVHNIIQCVYSLEYAQQLSTAAAKVQIQLQVDLKVDTGMGRLGYNARDNFRQAVTELSEACILPGLHPTGLFTHFAVADSREEEDVLYTKSQFALFQKVRNSLSAMGLHFRYAHCCNSAGLIARPEMHLDVVRPGIILYGCNPSKQVGLAGLRPVFSLKAAVTNVKTIKAGDDISYGRLFTAPHRMRVATLAVGYADGYPRLLSNKGVVSICGKPARVLGNVCMDQMVVDVTGIDDVHLGSIASIIGGAEADSIEDVADKSGTISYEILCDIGRRVQRVYLEEGLETRVADYMEEGK